MTLDEVREMLRRDRDLDGERLREVLNERPEGPLAVRKHEAKNWTHLREVLAECDAVSPRAGDTIRWLLWHDVLSQNRTLMFLEEVTP